MKIKPLKYNLPINWNALSPWQFERITWLLTTKTPSIKTDIKVLKALLNIRFWHVKSRCKLKLLLLNVPLSVLKKNYAFIYDKADRTIFPPKIKNLAPPMDRLINLTAAEFAAADDLHVKYRNTQDTTYLKYLAAVLYTSPKNHINRPEFNKLNLNTQVTPFKKVSLKKLIAVEIAFLGCKNIIAKRFKKAFPKPSPDAKPQKQKYGFGKVILEMTRGDLSKLKSIQDVNIYTFLEQFNQDIINAAKK